MRPAVSLLLTLVVAACAPGHPNPSAPRSAERWTVLPVSAGRDAFAGCSPMPPHRGEEHWAPEEFWVPDSAIVREIDRKVVVLLDSILPRAARANAMQITPRSEDYHRQYLGIVRGGERWVYVHGIHEVLERRFGRDAEARGTTWRNDVPSVCDAGSALFGVVYDPRTGAFDRLEFSHGYFGRVRY